MAKRAEGALKLQLRIYLFIIIIFITCACAVLYIFYGYHSLAVAIESIFFVVFLICFLKLIPDYWKKYTYSDKYKSLKICRGVIFKRTVYISSDSIQYIFISKSLLQRMLGICTVNFVMGAGIERLWGIKIDDAEKIRLKMER